jgi:ribosomal protein S18 acetylase RimI-like enzyme
LFEPASTFRDAREDELDALSTLIRAAYVEYESSYPPAVWPRYYEAVGNTRDLPDAAELIVAEREGRVVGCVTFYADGRESRQGEWPEGWAGILRLAVPPDERGAGVGRDLVEEAIRRSRERGVKALALHTTVWMDVARNMYERMGFVRVQSFDFHPRPGVIGMGYKLDL